MLKRALILFLVLVMFSTVVVFGANKAANSSTTTIDGGSNSTTSQYYYDEALQLEFENAYAEFSEAESNLALEVLEVFSAILDAKDSEEKYWLLIENNEKLNEIYAKVVGLEKTLYNISLALKKDKLEERIKERNKVIGLFYDHNRPTYASIYNLVTNNGKEKLTSGWIDRNYEDMYYKYLEKWGNDTIDGSACTVRIPNYIANIARGEIGSGTDKTLPEIYDEYAYMIYPWEHLGYNYRECQRTVDLLTTMQSACLLDLYYECKNRIEGEGTYKEHQKLLNEYLRTYEKTCRALPINRLEGSTRCQIRGAEGKKFSLTVDYLSLANRVRSACQNDQFSAIYKERFGTNSSLLNNALDYVDVYTDANLTQKGLSYDGQYTYQQEDTYRAIWNYYKERRSQGKTTWNRNYYDLYGALSMHGFKGLDGVGNLYLVVDPKTPYTAYGNGFTRNYVEYRSLYFHIKTSKRGDDSIWLTTFDNVGNRARQSLICDCNFYFSERLDIPGYNAHNNFISLRELK